MTKMIMTTEMVAPAAKSYWRKERSQAQYCVTLEELFGPPDVMAAKRSNCCRVKISPREMMAPMVERIIGRVIVQNRCRALAPSSSAAS